MIVVELIRPELIDEPISVDINGMAIDLSLDDARELVMALESAILEAEEFEL